MKRKGVIFLIAGVLGLVAGTGMLIYSVLSLIGSFQPVAVMESPGAVQIQIDEPGVYTLWHDHDTTHNGVTVSHEPGLPFLKSANMLFSPTWKCVKKFRKWSVIKEQLFEFR